MNKPVPGNSKYHQTFFKTQSVASWYHYKLYNDYLYRNFNDISSPLTSTNEDEGEEVIINLSTWK